MDNPDHYLTLAQAIDRLLKRPISITPAVAEFTASAMGLASPAEIVDVIAHGTADDQAQILDLLLFPDDEARVLLEPLIEDLPPRGDPLARSLAALKDSRPHLDLHLPEPDGQFRLALPVDTLERYLSRLYMDRQLDCETIDCIHQILPASHQGTVKVAIRHHKLPTDPRPWSLLRRFLRSMEPSAADYMGCMNMLLELLEARPVPDDYYPALAKQKHLYAGELRRWEQFNLHQKRLPMESLLLQGIHPPALTQETLLATLDRIDRLSLVLFRQVESSEPPQRLNKSIEPATSR